MDPREILNCTCLRLSFPLHRVDSPFTRRWKFDEEKRWRGRGQLTDRETTETGHTYGYANILSINDTSSRLVWSFTENRKVSRWRDGSDHRVRWTSTWETWKSSTHVLSCKQQWISIRMMTSFDLTTTPVLVKGDRRWSSHFGSSFEIEAKNGC